VSAVRLTLVSHGATAALRAARFPLDEPLEARALDAARSSNLRPPDHALSDSSARCRQTAAALGLDAAVDDRLTDLDTGRWSGLGLDEVDPAGLTAWNTIPLPHRTAGSRCWGWSSGCAPGWWSGPSAGPWP